MAKKNQYGFRNEVIKDFTPEQIHLLIMEKETLKSLNAERAFRRFIQWICKREYYMPEYGFFTYDSWKIFLEESARVREEKKDGFVCYSMAEKIGGKECQKLLKAVGGNKVLFGILVWYMIKYIVQDDDSRKEFTLDVMQKLPWKKSWVPNEDENIQSWGMRNFYGKTMAILKEKMMVKFLISEFNIKDGEDDDIPNEFVRAFANMYVFLEKNSEKYKGMLAGNNNSQSIAIHQDTIKREEEDVTSVLERLAALKKMRAEKTRNLEVAEATLKQADAEVKRISKLLQEASKKLTVASEKLADAKATAEALAKEYDETQKLFDRLYSQQFC